MKIIVSDEVEAKKIKTLVKKAIKFIEKDAFIKDKNAIVMTLYNVIEGLLPEETCDDEGV